MLRLTARIAAVGVALFAAGTARAGITTNGLYQNGLFNNGLSTNGRNVNGLNSYDINSNGATAPVSPLLTNLRMMGGKPLVDGGGTAHGR